MSYLLDSGLSEDEIQWHIEVLLSKHGRITHRAGGMCGQVYFFDQGENVHPRWIVAKIPRVPEADPEERNRRFLREIEIQHKTFYHRFVCWPFDYQIVHDTPVALYRAADADLSQWIPLTGFSTVSRLAFLAYLCAALAHCRSRGLENHQDLKPQNILVQDMGKRFSGLPDQNVFIMPLLADFGLANLWIENNIPQGARPYMAPEQWLHGVANGASDLFSLGVIIFEVMTKGHHPYGGITREWWPAPRENSKKWTKDDMWVKWAKNFCPVAPADFLVADAETIARACLSPDPMDRPSLSLVQAELLNILHKLDPEAAEQARFQIAHANASETSDEWPYRDHQLQRLIKHLGSPVKA